MLFNIGYQTFFGGASSSGGADLENDLLSKGKPKPDQAMTAHKVYEPDNEEPTIMQRNNEDLLENESLNV